MHTIELSRKMRANQPLVIPAELLNQHIGTQIRFIVQVDWVESGHHNSEPDAKWDEQVQRIKSRPIPPEYIKRPTKKLTRERLDKLLAQDNNPDFDLDEWNTEWDAFEAEQKRLSLENEQRFLDDMMRVLE